MEELLVKTTPASIVPQRHTGQQNGTDRIVEFSENWPARTIESPGIKPHIDSPDHDDDLLPFERDPLGDVDSMASKDECATTRPERLGQGTKGDGKLGCQ